MIETREQYDAIKDLIGRGDFALLSDWEFIDAGDDDEARAPEPKDVYETIEALLEVARAAETYDDQKLEETLKALPDWMKKKR